MAASASFSPYDSAARTLLDVAFDSHYAANELRFSRCISAPVIKVSLCKDGLKLLVLLASLRILFQTLAEGDI